MTDDISSEMDRKNSKTDPCLQAEAEEYWHNLASGSESKNCTYITALETRVKHNELKTGK